MDLQLANKLALVSGSTAGIGYSIAETLAAEGARGVGDFVEQLAREQGKTGAQVEKDFFAHVRPTSLINRFSNTQEIASMVAYLASPLASSTTGAAVRVDGGTVKSAF
jgi:NAD(P)-dependent dehydrogenase (short-subunit alcohol dehydrogenase family)